MRLATFPLVGLVCASAYLMAQEKPKPPAEVDQALRDRASQFMQFTIDRAFSKAYALVAEESRDWYLSSLKPQYTKFAISGIEYSDDLQQAEVKTKVTRILSMQGRETPSELVITAIWKMSEGKWMWYHDPDVLETPFGPVRMNRAVESHEASIPKDVGEEAAVRKVSELKGAVTADKGLVQFTQGTASSQQVIIQNGFPGEVEVDLDIVGDYASYSVEPKHAQLRPGEEIALKVSYKPLDRDWASTLRVQVQPFNRVVAVPIKLSTITAPAAPATH